MSLFDVIRYPISWPPREDELAALPQMLYNNWIESSDWRHYSNNTFVNGNYITRPAHISEWYLATGIHPGSHDHEDLTRLKQMIKDWDTDEPI